MDVAPLAPPQQALLQLLIAKRALTDTEAQQELLNLQTK
jgi:hypothetical protein